MSSDLVRLRRHVRELSTCALCPDMIGPVVHGNPVVSPVMLIGQAPGTREGPAGKPFAWTAGKTMFKWFDGIGIGENDFRERVYMAAVCRCFPGKNPKGGDRVPSRDEIAACSRWLEAEVALTKPELVLPVGKLAIAQLIDVGKLKDVVGVKHRVTFHGRETDVIPLPHPSGASTWHRMEPGKSLLAKALHLIKRHPAWKELI
jgi:uracil-DNA glycosylase